MNKQELARDLVRSCKMILQVLARSMVSKIEQDHLASICKINGKQDQARDLVRLSKIGLIQD
jgi:hypothetical protein